MNRYRCPHWTHDQHVTGGACDHCGAPVPIVTFSPDELEEARYVVDYGRRFIPPHLLARGPDRPRNVIALLRRAVGT